MAQFGSWVGIVVGRFDFICANARAATPRATTVTKALWPLHPPEGPLLLGGIKPLGLGGGEYAKLMPNELAR
jgi:hypothetical protein